MILLKQQDVADERTCSLRRMIQSLSPIVVTASATESAPTPTVLATLTSADAITSGAKGYYLQAFVERDTVPDKNLSSPDPKDMEKYLEAVKKYVPDAELRGM